MVHTDKRKARTAWLVPIGSASFRLRGEPGVVRSHLVLGQGASRLVAVAQDFLVERLLALRERQLPYL